MSDGEISTEDFNRMLEAIYRDGGSPEIVYGKCPHCGEPFHYEYGKILAGHMPSECPHEAA